jgi:ketosteroid isomerase-like protein
VSAAGGHPSDADREAAALPVLEAAIAAARDRDAAALLAVYDDDAVWLADGETVRGGAAAAERHLAVATAADGWADAQQHGARAALRWSAGDARGAIIVEVRRGRIIFAAAASG